MWESPLYPLNAFVGTDSGGRRVYKEVVIDVTRSAPPFATPGKTLTGALAQVIAKAGLPKDSTILDFGAGKLRNALHLLNAGYEVCGVEYKQLFDDSPQASAALSKAMKYRRRFSRLLFPHEFVRSTRRFDLVLLINVLNIMPVPAERLVVLQLCHEKLKVGGHLLWYTQRGDRTYISRMTPAYAIGDGYFVGRNARFKTFYREFTVADIDQMLAAAGFELVAPIDATARNQARLYRRLAQSPLAGALTANDIERADVVDTRIATPQKVAPRVVRSTKHIRKGHPDPGELQLPALLSKQLAAIPTGNQNARKYQRHVKTILELLFRKELKHFQLEVSMFAGRRRLDIVARNKSRSGFFHSLKEDHDKRCPYIVIECKNYRDEPGNPEFDQLGSRLGNRLGRVGILAFRGTSKRSRVIDRCADVLTNDDKLIIPLSDRNFDELVQLWGQDNPEAIEDYLDDIIQQITTT
jgi:methyltransferase family protein